MKKFLKYAGITFLGMFVLAVVVAILGGGEETQTNTPEAEEKPTEAKQDTKKEDSNTVTLETYDKIIVGDTMTGEGGMTFEEVTALFGKDPETKSESQSGDMVMTMAGWTAEGFENLGDNISVTFINGKASSKAQYGLDD